MTRNLSRFHRAALWLAAPALGLSMLTVAPRTSEALPMPGAALQRAASGAQDVQTVQWRRHGGYRHGGYRHGGHYRYGHRRGWGPGAGLGIGLATGALIGGAIASQGAYAAAPYEGDADAYCASRFRSYDPASGTYLGYDGRRHACP